MNRSLSTHTQGEKVMNKYADNYGDTSPVDALMHINVDFRQAVEVYVDANGFPVAHPDGVVDKSEIAGWNPIPDDLYGKLGLNV